MQGESVRSVGLCASVCAPVRPHEETLTPYLAPQPQHSMSNNTANTTNTTNDSMNYTSGASPSTPRIPQEFLDEMRNVWEKHIVFNRVIGLEITEMTAQAVRAQMPMKEDLVGHFLSKRIHGGAIAAGLDAMGGLAVMVALADKHTGESPQQLSARFQALGTIDLRIDYLRPGIESACYHIMARCVKAGSRVANTLMEFTADDGRLIAIGTGAYIVS